MSYTDNDKCPEAITRAVGDETYTTCGINTKICLLESGDECDYYNEYLAELAEPIIIKPVTHWDELELERRLGN